MSYVLDGIETAMEETVENHRDMVFYTCPCGFEVALSTKTPHPANGLGAGAEGRGGEGAGGEALR